jgi:hypothetical protein
VRRVAQVLLLLCVFAIPWEYSLDLGAPFGNIARIFGLLTLLAVVPALLQAGGMRPLARLHWLVLVLFLWLCCSLFWSINPAATLEKLRGYFQEMMIAWLVWELADSADNLMCLFRAWMAGSWVLAGLTLASLASVEGIAAGQSRFVAAGQDPNDVARFLALGFPVATMLAVLGQRRTDRWLGLGYFPIGIAAVLVTGSRGGTVAAMAAMAGCAVLLLQKHRRTVFVGVFCLPLLALALWLTVPHATFDRISTILDQIHGGDLNQRTRIWAWGWGAFAQRPFLGSGAGTFVAAAGVAQIDTAHNTALSILVESGVIGLGFTTAIFAECTRLIRGMNEVLRVGFATLLVVWSISSMVGTAAESRTTWLMFGAIAVAWHLGKHEALLARRSVTLQPKPVFRDMASTDSVVGPDLGSAT